MMLAESNSERSVLLLLLFLVYINDVAQDVDSDIYLFADDTSIFRSGINNLDLANGINSDLNKISLWANGKEMENQHQSI